MTKPKVSRYFLAIRYFERWNTTKATQLVLGWWWMKLELEPCLTCRWVLVKNHERRYSSVPLHDYSAAICIGWEHQDRLIYKEAVREEAVRKFI